MNRPLVLLFVLAVATTATAAAPSVPLKADLAWQASLALGSIETTGAGGVLYVPMNLEAPVPALLLELEAENIVVRSHFRNYVETAGGVAASPDGQPQTQERNLGRSSLRAGDARAEAQLMAVPSAADPALATFTLPSPTVAFEAEQDPRVSFFRTLPGSNPPPEFDRAYTVPGTSLRLLAPEASAPTVVTGDFTIYLWDVDVREPDAGGETFQSGVLRGETTGASPLTPGGLASQTRLQLLEIELEGGRLTVLFPHRLVEAHFGPAGVRVGSEGTWDLVGAIGQIDWNGAIHEVGNNDVHLEGAFEVALTPDGPDRLVSRWDGRASHVTAASGPLTAGTIAAPKAWPWLPWILGLGIALAAAGGTSPFLLRRNAARVAPAPPAPFEAPEPFFHDVEAADDGVQECIALLRDGKARQVLDKLEPTFRQEEPVAGIKAYLIGLAYLKLDRREPGIVWTLRAVRLYSDFANELVQNEAFAAIRDDPRIQRFLDEEWGSQGYA